MKKGYYWMALSGLLMASCTEETEPVGPDVSGGTPAGREISFVFPGTARGEVPYTKAIASEAENGLQTLDIYVFTEDTLSAKTPKPMLLEEIYRSDGTGTEEKGFALGTSADAKTAKISVSPGENKSFYFVANSRGERSLDGVELNVTDTTAFRKLMTNKQEGLLACPLLMSAVCDTTMSTVKGNIKVSLTRRVARFDISNDALATKFVIQKIGLENVPQWGPIFPGTGYATERLAKLPVIDFSSLENSNAGETYSVFYLYPLSEAEMTKSGVKLTMIGQNTDGVAQIVDVPIQNYETKKPIAITPNNRYKVVVEERGLGTLTATLTVLDWEPGDTLDVQPDLGTIALRYDEPQIPVEGVSFTNNTLTVGSAKIEDADAIRINVECGSEWELVPDGNNWITAIIKNTKDAAGGDAAGDNVDYIAITTTANPGSSPREGTVIVQNKIRPSVRQPLVIRQSGATKYIDVTADLKWEAGVSFGSNQLNLPGLLSNATTDDDKFTVTLKVAASAAWEMTSGETLGDGNWATVTADTDNNTLTVVAAQNKTKDNNRDVEITLQLTDDATITQTVKIHQSAPDFGTIRLSCKDMGENGSVTVPATGFANDADHVEGKSKISVAANTEWKYQIRYDGDPDNPDAEIVSDWLTVDDKTIIKGTQNGSVSVTARENEATAKRAATVIIVNTVDNYVSSSIQFIQEGAAPAGE